MQLSAPTARRSVIARSSGGKIDIKKQGLESVKNKTVANNLKGVSDKMKDKNWKDASGRKGAHPASQPSKFSNVATLGCVHAARPLGSAPAAQRRSRAVSGVVDQAPRARRRERCQQRSHGRISVSSSERCELGRGGAALIVKSALAPCGVDVISRASRARSLISTQRPSPPGRRARTLR